MKKSYRNIFGLTVLALFLSSCVAQPSKTYPYLSEHTAALKDGKYINPITGTDSAGRAPDDPYYGGDSDYGTAGGSGPSYAVYNNYFNKNRDLQGGIEIGINPSSFAGSYTPDTGTYIPLFLDNYVGPGDALADMRGLVVGKQRDELIKQELYQ
jgi:hypothetical protein